MRKIFFVFIFLYSISASSKSLDSLFYLLRTSKLDTHKVKLYAQISYEFYLIKSKLDSSIKYSKLGIELGSKIKFDEGLAENYEMLGVTYIVNGQYQLASENYFKALLIREKLPNKSKIGFTYRKVGDAYSLLLETKKAHEFYLKAYQLINENTDLYQKMVCVHNMGNNFRRGGNYLKALEMYRKSLPLYQKIDPIKGVADPYEEMGVCYGKLKDFRKAEYYLLEAYRLSNLLKDENNFKAHVLNQITIMYEESKQFDKCIKYGILSFEKSSNLKINASSYQSASALYKSYKFQKNLKQALFFHEKMEFYKETMDKADHQKAIESISLGYEFDKQKQNIKIQEFEIEKQKRNNFILISGLLTFLIFSLALIYFLIQLQKQKKIISSVKNDLEELNKDLESKVAKRTLDLNVANKRLETMNQEIIDALIKGQTIERKRVASELHDNLGGQITAIRWSLMALENIAFNEKESKIFQNIKLLTEKTYNEVRNISHNLLPNEFEKDGLVGALNKMIVNLQSNDKFKFRLDCGNYTPLSKTVEFEIYSILLELVTNSLKHSNGDLAIINLDVNQEMCTIITYEDNGTNFQKEPIEGNGLKNIRDRALAINGKISYFNSFELKIMPQDFASPGDLI